ncbi:hypothetical protein [Cellulomonas sp. URHB0016]
MAIYCLVAVLMTGIAMLRDAGGEGGKVASIAGSVAVLTVAGALRVALIGLHWIVAVELGSALMFAIIVGTRLDPMNAVVHWPGETSRMRHYRSLRPSRRGAEPDVRRKSAGIDAPALRDGRRPDHRHRAGVETTAQLDDRGLHPALTTKGDMVTKKVSRGRVVGDRMWDLDGVEWRSQLGRWAGAQEVVDSLSRGNGVFVHGLGPPFRLLSRRESAAYWRHAERHFEVPGQSGAEPEGDGLTYAAQVWRASGSSRLGFVEMC